MANHPAPTPDQFIYVATTELALGVARRPCPFCRNPLVVKLPSVDEAVRDRGSHALKLGMDELTQIERELFDIVYGYYPQAVSQETVIKALDGISKNSLGQHVHRLRGKLVRHHWLLVSYHKALRLVEPVPLP